MIDRRMRVLTFTSLFPNHRRPNNGIFIFQRMKHVGELPGHEVRAVAPIPYCPPWVDLPPWNAYKGVSGTEEIGGMTIHHPRYPLVPRVSMPAHALLLFAGTLKTVRQIARVFPFDLIDGHFIYPDGLAAVWLGRVFRKPVVLSARGSDINQFARFALIRPMIRRALLAADAVISVCQALKDEMAALGIDRQKIRVIPNGVDPLRFQPMDRRECRSRLGISPDARMVLTVGHLISRKGFHLLIAALPDILARHPRTRLYIVGEGPQRQELERQIGALGLTGKVFLVGERPNRELAAWYSAADVFCLASSREGWANVIMEAMACGCPVIATNVYGAPEAVTAPHLGTLVARDPAAFAGAVSAALDATWDRARIRAHVVDKNWYSVARQVDEVFTRCLNGHSAKGILPQRHRGHGEGL